MFPIRQTVMHLQLMNFPCAGTSIIPTYFPFSCIGSVLQKIEQDGAEVVVIALLFSTHPRFLKLLQMVVRQPYLLQIPEKILTLPGSNIKHPLRKRTLSVFKISGKKSSIEANQRTLPVLSIVPGEALLEDSMGRISKNGCFFCSAEQIHQLNPSINCVVKFLNKLLQDGLEYSAINTTKSAISSAVSVENNINIVSHPLLKKHERSL